MLRIELNRSWAAAAPRALCVVLISCAVAWGQPPHAVDPLPNPYFSIDPASPTLTTAGLTPTDVLDKPGPMAVVALSGLGPGNPLDNLDALSADRFDLEPTVTFAILFSVDRASVGAVPPDPGLVAMNRPFNVQDQAAHGQAAGDLFMSTQLFTIAGPVPGLPRSVDGNNTDVINSGDTGGVDYDLKPKKNPKQLNTSPEDDVDAIIDKDNLGGPLRGVSSNGVFFSLSRESPSLEELPGTPSGANVYFDFEPDVPGGEFLYVGAQQLGLLPGPTGDDITALLVIDNGDRIFTPAQDRIIFTLGRGSPSLQAGGTDFSPADIFFVGGSGGMSRLSQASDLGLAAGDHIDALEVLITNDIDDAIFRHALLGVLPGDINSDGILTSTDCDGFAACYSGDGVSYDSNGVAVHSVGVGPGPQFVPGNITVQTGDRVNWIWADGPHNVVSGNGTYDGAFFSGPPVSTPGASFFIDFDEPLLNLYPRGGGVYHYFSSPDAAAGMVGRITVQAHPCATFDLDFDGDVDCLDWRELKSLYLQYNMHICVPLTIPQFVAVLIDQPMDPSHPCLADMNDDNLNDGIDIRFYVDAYLAAP